MFWDFISLRPESTHQVMILFGDRGIPDGYRHMNGYGSHTFKLVNDKNEMVWCKFHYKVDFFSLVNYIVEFVAYFHKIFLNIKDRPKNQESLGGESSRDKRVRS